MFPKAAGVECAPESPGPAVSDLRDISLTRHFLSEKHTLSDTVFVPSSLFLDSMIRLPYGGAV